MKKFFSALFSVVLLAACAKEYVGQDQASMVFTTGFESPDARIHLNDKLLSRWDAEDKVSIFVGNTYNQKYMFKGATGDNSGSFTKVDPPEFFSGEKLAANYSVYPYNSGTSISETGEVSFDFPSTQAYASGSYGLGANTMVAVTESTADNFLLYKNVCGYLKVSFYGDAKVKSITLQGNNGERIAGAGVITAIYDQAPTVSMASSATGVITLDCGEGVQLGSNADNATDFYFVIPPVVFAKGITIRAVDASGKEFYKSTGNSVAVIRNKIQKMYPLMYEGIPSGNIEFVDKSFKSYCVERFDIDGDGEISYVEASQVDSIYVSDKIYAMDEIRYFTSLKALYCQGNQLSSLNVRENTELRTLYCGSNRLSLLDVTRNAELTSLSCDANQIKSLDLRYNTKLKLLSCQSNQLAEIDLSKNAALESLNCDSNQLTSLDVKANTALKSLSCSSNKLESLDLTTLASLVTLTCESNSLAALDLSGNAALEDLSCSSNNLEALDVKGHVAIKSITCDSNLLKSLDVTGDAALESLYCGSNKLTSLDVTSCKELLYLYCYSNAITKLDVSKCTALERLYCNSNDLRTLDVSNNAALKTLYCKSNPALTEIWLKTGQVIATFLYDDTATVRYK